MAKPTLYDLCLSKGMISLLQDRKLRTLATGELHASLREAVPFVIDGDTLTTANLLRQGLMYNPKLALPDLALLPFDQTFIEYDPRHPLFLKNDKDPEEKETHFGHLIFKVENGVSCLSIVSGRKLVMVAPYIFNWCVPDCEAPVRQFVGDDNGKIMKEPGYFRSVLLTGKADGALPGWVKRFGGDIFMPVGKNKIDALGLTVDMMSLLLEHGACASLLMAVLTLMAMPQTKHVQVAPQGRWVGAGVKGSKPFHKHTVVRIETKERFDYVKAAKQLNREIQRRAQHDVREHWRVYRRGRPDEYRVKISSHKRGDPNVGIITHDRYETVQVHRER